MDIERAKAVVQVADAITATAKVEVEHMKVTGSRNATGFIPSPSIGPGQALSGPQRPAIEGNAQAGAAISKGK